MEALLDELETELSAVLTHCLQLALCEEAVYLWSGCNLLKVGQLLHLRATPLVGWQIEGGLAGLVVTRCLLRFSLWRTVLEQIG